MFPIAGCWRLGHTRKVICSLKDLRSARLQPLCADYPRIRVYGAVHLGQQMRMNPSDGLPSLSWPSWPSLILENMIIGPYTCHAAYDLSTENLTPVPGLV